MSLSRCLAINVSTSCTTLQRLAIEKEEEFNMQGVVIHSHVRHEHDMSVNTNIRAHTKHVHKIHVYNVHSAFAHR